MLEDHALAKQNDKVLMGWMMAYMNWGFLQVGKQGHLERMEIPTKLKLLPDPWTPEIGLVTAAMKIKREAIRKTFANDLKALYQ